MAAIPPGFKNGIAYVKNEPIAILYVAVGPRSSGFTTNINVIREPSHGLTDINTITQAELSTLKGLQPPAHQISSQRLTVGGDPARTLDYLKSTATRVPVHARQVFVEHGGWIYTITYSARPTSYSASLRALTQMLSSWRWT